MKDRLLTFIFLVAGLLMVASPIVAHHGTGISYDLTKQPITAKAIVTEYKWANPHIQIFIDVKDDKGNVEQWSIEGNSPYNWARMGWNRKTLKAGDEIVITFYPSKLATVHAVVIAKAITSDGKEILRFQRDTPTTGDGVR